ncbi:MAG: AAA family ATPase [Anaerolineae bacterium]|nr:AAA family ATPase [Anaerolineae bacterium]
MTESAVLTMRLFGAPELHVHGTPLALKNQKARALLFYLAITAQPHTRAHLAALLWSEYPAASAGGSLRATLFQLRRALQTAALDRILLAEGDLIGLQATAVTCDVTQFCSLVADGREPSLAQAIDLYRGPLLDGFTLPDTPLFDDWWQLEEEKLRQRYLNALKQLAEMTAVRHDHSPAIAYLQRLVQADPLAEEAQQQLIRLHLESDQISQALRQYQQFESELHKKMGLPPAPATRALFQEALRRQQAQLPARLTAKPDQTKRGQPVLPFVGRDGLLAQLLVIAQEVKRGHGRTVLLQGDGGIGKTRLLQEFLARLTVETPPWLLLQGACSPFDDLISFGPFLEAFQETPLGDLTEQLLTPKTDAPAARDQFTYHILQTLRRLSQNAPLVLAVDDLQWANSSTLNLFGLLATRLHHLPVLLVGTAQRPETIPALQRLVTLARRRGQLHLLSLPPLTDTAVTHLLQNLAIAPPAIPSLAHWLQARADGNPFVLDEIIAQLRAEGVLIPMGGQWQGGQWQLDPGRWLRWRAAYTLPETTYDLVSWRLRHLTPEAHALLAVLAVAGQPLPLALLADFAGTSEDQLAAILDDLSARGLLVESSGELFALSHYLLRETVLQRLSHVRRRLVHRQLAQQMAHCPALQATFPLWEIARHAVAGEDVALARQYGLPILGHLPRDFTGAVTVDFLHHLYDLLAPTAAPDERLRLARAIADGQQALGHLAEAAHWQQRYLELAQQTGNVAAQVAAHLEMGELALISNDYVAATKAAGAGLTASVLLAESDPAYHRLTGRGHRLLGHALAMEGGDLAGAEHHLQAATAVHRQSNHPRDLCASLFELGNVAAQQGRLLPALELYEEAAHVAEAGQAHYFHALARNNLAYHSLLLGWLKAAQRALAQGQWLAETHELLGAVLHLSSTQGEIHLYLAEWEAAEEAFQGGLMLAEELGNLERQAGYRAGLALAARGLGDGQRAQALLEEALLLINGHGYWHLRARLLIWLAETLVLAEEWGAARPSLTAALETTQTHNRALLQLQAERLQAALLGAQGDWPSAEACFAQAMSRATDLDLPLEIARTQAMWGRTAVRFATSPHQGQHLLAQARQLFADHEARAELLALA